METIVKKIKERQNDFLSVLKNVRDELDNLYQFHYKLKIDNHDKMYDLLKHPDVEILKDKSVKSGRFFKTINPDLTNYFVLKSIKRTNYLLDYYVTKNLELYHEYLSYKNCYEKYDEVLKNLSNTYHKTIDTIINSLDYYLINFRTENQGFLILTNNEIYGKSVNIHKLANTLGVNPNDVANINCKYKTYIFVNIEGIEVELYHPDLSCNNMNISIEFGVNRDEFNNKWGEGLKIGENTYYC